MKIFNYEPYVIEEDIDSVVECLKKGIANPLHVIEVETLLSERFKCEATVCSSGTSAIHLALLAKGIGPGDEVICPDYTFAATWNAITYTGAKPVFVDVCKDTWCIDTNAIKKLINKNTKAIIPVDIFGNACDYEKLLKLAKDHNLFLIQDAAESLGTIYNREDVLKYCDISCTSFNLNKIITSCGGGAIFCKDKKVLAKIKGLINQNKKENTYDYYDIGFNYRMGSLNAALLRPQIERINEIIERKRDLNKKYKEKLELLDRVTFQKQTQGTLSNCWANVIMLPNKRERDDLLLLLNSKGIETKLTFTPASLVDWISEKYKIKEKFENSKSIFNTTLILPSSPGITNSQLEFICSEIVGYYERKK